MAMRTPICCRMVRRAIAVVLVSFAVASLGTAVAQILQRAVGGVSINADGLLENVTTDDQGVLRLERERSLAPVAGELNAMTKLRKISLRMLEAAIAEQKKTGAQLSDEMKYLAGLQRIQYVFVYPEQRDIVLAGPGEGWTVNAQGEVVGRTTGRPVLLLDDLLVALRSAETARQTGITCSIVPSDEAIARLQRLVKKLDTIGTDPAATVSTIVQTLGPHAVEIEGIPPTSHFARVIAAADFKMKRLAMGFDEAPVKGMPSYLSLAKAGPKGISNVMPRWWLTPNYDSLLADPDGLAWELRGVGVKVMAEEEFVALESGARQRTSTAKPLTVRWADSMTAHYDELSAKEAVFGQLRNCIDLALVGALIEREHLTEKSGTSLPVLMHASELPAEEFNVPRQVDSKASVLQKGTNWVIMASGGVQIAPWHMIEKSQASANLTPLRTKAVTAGKNWWWN